MQTHPTNSMKAEQSLARDRGVQDRGVKKMTSLFEKTLKHTEFSVCVIGFGACCAYLAG